MAIALYCFRLPMYWSTKASGALAAHMAITSGRTVPFSEGRSRYSGGFLGFGDHAAAEASCARRPNGSLAESAGDFPSSSALSLVGFDGPAARGVWLLGLLLLWLL